MADPIKQYVNLPYDAAKNQGSRIVYEVTGKDIGDEDKVLSEWWVEATGTNTDIKYLTRKARARMRRTYVKNKKDKFKNTIYLPHVGGDRCKVKCSKKGDRSKAVEKAEVETWRKLFYTVHYMNAQCKKMHLDLKTDFEKAFADSFIELERVGLLPTKEDEPRTRSTNSLSHLYNKKPRLSDRPFHLRLVIINDLYENKTKRKTVNGKTTAVFSVPLSYPLRDAKKKYIIYCRVRVGKGGWRNVNKYVKPSGDSQVDVDLTKYKWINKQLAKGRKFKFKIMYKARSHYLGHSIGNFCCVRIKEAGSEADRKKTILQTLTHEVGHGCQQVVRRERTYSAKGAKKKFEKNPTWYTDKYGGQGPHCSINAELRPTPPNQDATGTTSGQEYEWKSGTLCTMFHKDNSNVDAKGAFCASCKPRLQRVDLGRRNMRKKGWNSY